MSYTKDTIDGKAVVRIDTSLTIYDVPALHEEFINCFGNGTEVTVHMGEVIEFDAAGLQLLCAACKNAREDRQAFQVVGASEAIMDALYRLGLDANEII